MCCLFGLLDYKGTLSYKDKNTVISVLSTECEARGTDATGVAYNVNNSLYIYKRPLPAHKLRYAIPSRAHYIMGHTRMTTQGSEKRNYNNHPFLGSVKGSKFALAHNGIINNDNVLRKSEKLPVPKIQTDSYVAVQLIEKQNTLNFNSLKQMAEKVEGSFTFTVIDSRDHLYIVRGVNPFCMYHYPKYGFYLYASTEEILTKAVTKLGLQDCQKETVSLSYGDMMKIDNQGKQERGSFEIIEPYSDWSNRHYGYYNRHSLRFIDKDDTYLRELKSIAFYYGYSPDDIDVLLADGFSCEEIEEMLCEHHF